jgi:hypothetical protein
MTPPLCAPRTAHTRGARSSPLETGPRPLPVRASPTRSVAGESTAPARLLWTFTRSVCTCEHAFVSERSPYVRFRRSLETRRLSDALEAAADVPWLNVSDSLEILTLMAQEADSRFDKAAARWIGRLLVETPPLTLAEVRWVLAMVERLPRCYESLHRYARRH